MAKQVCPKSAQGSASSLIFTFDVKLARCFVVCFLHLFMNIAAT